MFKKLESYESVALKLAYDLIDQYAAGCYVSGIESWRAVTVATPEGARKIRTVVVWTGTKPGGCNWSIRLSATPGQNDWKVVGASYFNGFNSFELVAVADLEFKGEYFFVPSLVDKMPKVIKCLQVMDNQMRAETLYEWGLQPGIDELLPGLNKAISRLAGNK